METTKLNANEVQIIKTEVRNYEDIVSEKTSYQSKIVELQNAIDMFTERIANCDVLLGTGIKAKEEEK